MNLLMMFMVTSSIVVSFLIYCAVQKYSIFRVRSLLYFFWTLKSLFSSLF